MKPSLRFCPICGNESFAENAGNSYQCGYCGFLLFLNTAAAVGAIIEYEEQILFTVRARPPDPGKLDLPGGFVDPQETAEQALARELVEELGLTDLSFKYLCSFPNNYPYAGVTYNTTDLIFITQLDAKPALNPADDVASFCWIPKNQIPFENIAFSSVRQALRFHLT